MHDGDVTCREPTAQVVDVADDLHAGDLRQRAGWNTWAGDDDRPQAGDAIRSSLVGLDDAPQQGRAGGRAAGRRNADAIVVAVAELCPQGVAVQAGSRSVVTRDVAREREMLLRPLADVREIRTETVRHDVAGGADEDRPIANAWIALDLLEHLGVVVSGEEGLALVSLGEREEPDEVGEPGVSRAFAFRVLVEEVVDLPRLVADPEVVGLPLDDVVEEHEVRQQDLVHPTVRLEDVQLVPVRLGVDVRRLAGELRTRGMDASPSASRTRVTGS